MFFPSQDSGPYLDAPGGVTHGAEQLPIGAIEIPFGFKGELTAKIVGSVLVTGEGQTAGETGFFKRWMEIDLVRHGNGSIEILDAQPNITKAHASNHGQGFVFTFAQGEVAGTIKLMVAGVNDRDASIEARLELSGSNVSI